MQDLIKQSESEFDEKFNAFPENPIDYVVKKEIIDLIKNWHTKQMKLAYELGYNTRTKETNSGKLMYERGREDGVDEYKQFILNILDGIDIVDKEMNNNCGTKTIRLAISSRI